MIHDNSPVLAPQRREQIRCLIRDEGVVRVQDLLQSLGVSVATIRRDLEILEEEGKVQRVHGGAITMEGRLEEALFDDKKIRANKEKSLIAEEAYKLIGNGDSLYLDGGSTTLGLARMLTPHTRAVAGVLARLGRQHTVCLMRFSRQPSQYVFQMPTTAPRSKPPAW